MYIMAQDRTKIAKLESIEVRETIIGNLGIDYKNCDSAVQSYADLIERMPSFLRNKLDIHEPDKCHINMDEAFCAYDNKARCVPIKGWGIYVNDNLFGEFDTYKKCVMVIDDLYDIIAEGFGSIYKIPLNNFNKKIKQGE